MAPEIDMMVCRSCGNEERASEGYPCDGCGTFVCLICTMRGASLCKGCRDKRGVAAPPDLPGPTHPPGPATPPAPAV